MKRIVYLLGVILILSHGSVRAMSAVKTQSQTLTAHNHQDQSNQLNDDYVEVTHLFSGYRAAPASVMLNTNKTKSATSQAVKAHIERLPFSTSQLYLNALDQVLPLANNTDYRLSVLVPEKKRLTTLTLRERLDLSLMMGRGNTVTGTPDTVLKKIRAAGFRLDYHFDTV